MLTAEEQQNIQQTPEQPQQSGTSQQPVAAVLHKPLTVQEKVHRQIKTEELVSNPSFRGHPEYDMSLTIRSRIMPTYKNLCHTIHKLSLIGQKT